MRKRLLMGWGFIPGLALIIGAIFSRKYLKRASKRLVAAQHRDGKCLS